MTMAASDIRQLLICCIDPEKANATNTSKKIDRELEKEKQKHRRLVKILLLGAGESGKSTFIKQMKIIHGHDWDEEQVREYRMVVYQNIIKGTKVLVDARNKLGIPWEDPSNEEAADLVLRSQNNLQHIECSAFNEYVDLLKKLWTDSGIQAAFDRRREYQLSDAVKYFLDELDRIGKPNYVPTRLDILHARKATKGIIEHEFNIKSIPFLFIDVGGQRSQRQKWFQCFDGVTSILFLVSSSEYDQVLMEDRCTNRLMESCHIFETIVNNKCFSNVSIILFLNKTDLLSQKVEKVSIADYFPEFQGESDKLADVQNFILNMFDSTRKERNKPLFHHYTTAIDTENIKFVFQAVKDTILQDNLKSLMLQ